MTILSRKRISTDGKKEYKLLEQHTVAISALQIDVKTIKDAVFNNFTDNVFFENFAALDDITLTEGWYDEANKRLVVL
ncbi:hypothetical protein P4V40_22055 [Brevibacillus laterosporus]|uniref:hypothetical protein n=1 Tax=Brevibacillus laterosporus TaxID=1465 RepID=UPI002EB02C6B|nr:hypothetical protein [Brevibacillus laterosporus]